jgi:LmbE family N-acetylglucosaminyl deacetylase
VTALFVSPHLDDAALSCGAQLIDTVRRGGRVVVATVFTEGTRRYRARRDEDRRALEGIGAEVRHLGLRDAPFRLGCGFDADALTASPSQSDVDAVEEALAPLFAELAPQAVWLPAGIGGHVDHRAVSAVRHLGGARVKLYAERPYAFDEVLLSAGLRGAELREVTFPKDELDRVVALVDAYRTQVSRLFGRPSCRPAYARHALQGTAYIEQLVCPLPTHQS